MGTIKPHSKIMANLDNAQFMQFFYNIILVLTTPIANISQLTAVWTNFKAAVQRLDDSFKWPAKAPQTRKLKELDSQRDGLLTILFNIIKDTAKYAVDPDIKESAEELKDVVDNFSKAKAKDYEGETALVINFLQVLETPEYVVHTDRLGLGNNMTALKDKNQEFEEMYVTRNDIVYTHVVSGTTGKLRKVVISAFDNLNTAIEGLLVMETDPAAQEMLKDIALKINAEIVKATTVVDRHLGITSSQGGSSNNDDADVIIVLPDIENPAAPDLPPQNPENTPPAINPDDLNPPSAGEH